MGKGNAVDNTHRRTWDRDEYGEKAEEREQQEKDKEENPMDAKRRRRWERDPLHQGLIVQRSHLKSREFQLDLTSRLGKTQVITLNTPLNQQAGYYCSVCDCILRDSQSYLDHINGKWHNRALGMSMRVERSTVDQVRKRLALHRTSGKRRHDGQSAGGSDGLLELEGPDEEFDLEGDTQPAKKLKEAEDEDGGDAEGLDSEAAALMGFSGFGGSKK